MGILGIVLINYFCIVERNFQVFERPGISIDAYSLIKQIKYETSYLLHYAKDPVW